MKSDVLNFIYYTIIFIIIITGVIFILLSIFKFHFSFFTYYSETSFSNNNANNNNHNNNIPQINSTIAVYLYYKSGLSISFIQQLPEGINYVINTSYYNLKGVQNTNLLQIIPSLIINNTFNIYTIQSADCNNIVGNGQPCLQTNITLENITTNSTSVSYNGYTCSVSSSSSQTYPAGGFALFCIVCYGTNNPNSAYYYINNPIQINITPGISLLNNFPNTNYYNYTVTLTLQNETIKVIPLAVQGAYQMPNFQTVLVKITSPFNQYVNNNGDNVIFFTQDIQNGQYYALPSWYAGENNGNYYFFVNLLEFPELYEENLQGCAYLPLYIGFTNNNLYSILNGTIGGDPIAIDPNNPVSVMQYDNGPNVFPIYVNFYNYGYHDHWQEIGNNIYQWYDFSNVLPTYNYWTLNGSIITGNPSLQVTSNGPMYGLEMLNGTNQGSYILINSTVLNYYFQNYLNSQGVGINTFVYFSGIPWEDSPPSDPYNPFGSAPLVSDGIVISYITKGTPLTPSIVVSFNSMLPTNNLTFVLFEYGWGTGAAGSGEVAGYYVGQTDGNNYQFYYGGSGWSWIWNWFSSGWKLNYYFGQVINNQNNIQSSSQYIPFDPQDQQKNQNYDYYGILYTYLWYNISSQNPSNINTYFLVNGNIYNSPLPKSNYQWSCSWSGCYHAEAIIPEPPSSYFIQSYHNAYQTAFVAEGNVSLNNYQNPISPTGLSYGFIYGTFGYKEKYGNIRIDYLNANAQYYQGTPYLFISTGSGAGSGYMYLDWVIATFGVPYEINVP
ncbi:hypothetical protein YN1_3820 [Nanoarchaeota archaeon]